MVRAPSTSPPRPASYSAPRDNEARPGLHHEHVAKLRCCLHRVCPALDIDDRQTLFPMPESAHRAGLRLVSPVPAPCDRSIHHSPHAPDVRLLHARGPTYTRVPEPGT